MSKLSAEEAAREYAETHNVQKLLVDLLQQLIVYKPENPTEFMIETLSRPKGPKLVLLGPHGSGKATQAQRIADAFGTVVLRPAELVQNATKSLDKPIAQRALQYAGDPDRAPDDLIIQLLGRFIDNDEQAQRKGWLIVDWPKTKAQAQALQAAGIVPDQVLALDASEAALRDRVFIDSEREGIVQAEWDAYNKSVAGVLQAFGPLVTLVNVEHERDEVAAALHKLVAHRNNNPSDKSKSAAVPPLPKPSLPSTPKANGSATPKAGQPAAAGSKPSTPKPAASKPSTPTATASKPSTPKAAGSVPATPKQSASKPATPKAQAAPDS
eukprot:TRINITY_DN14704_c0_g1_i1.p1 TRINITY_DN14704_c0_g1~~TRINITY_DN14704_c0_g1_i1.p1  ORF type:complete len:326 (-),score=81.27 TRINITY_DN14704_c0_g1_i1:596-1573(-)